MYMMYNSQQVCRASIDISTPNDKRVVSTAFQFSSNNYCQTVGTRLGRNAHDGIIAFDVYCNDRTTSKAYNCSMKFNWVSNYVQNFKAYPIIIKFYFSIFFLLL